MLCECTSGSSAICESGERAQRAGRCRSALPVSCVGPTSKRSPVPAMTADLILTYLRHFLFQACFVPLIAMWTDPASPERPLWAEKVREARETMARAQGDPLAERCLAIMDQVTPSDIVPGGGGAPVAQIQDIFSANLWQGTEFPGEL